MTARRDAGLTKFEGSFFLKKKKASTLPATENYEMNCHGYIHFSITDTSLFHWSCQTKTACICYTSGSSTKKYLMVVGIVIESGESHKDGPPRLPNTLKSHYPSTTQCNHLRELEHSPWAVWLNSGCRTNPSSNSNTTPITTSTQPR
jgi:hypothetical protein